MKLLHGLVTSAVAIWLALLVCGAIRELRQARREREEELTDLEASERVGGSLSTRSSANWTEGPAMLDRCGSTWREEHRGSLVYYQCETDAAWTVTTVCLCGVATWQACGKCVGMIEHEAAMCEECWSTIATAWSCPL